MELRNRNLNIIKKKEEILMELIRIAHGTLDIINETVYMIKSAIKDRKNRLPKELIEGYSTQGFVDSCHYKGIGTFGGYRVIKSPRLMAINWIYFGGAFTKFPKEDGYKEAVISVDANFSELSTNAKRFVLYHELGHLKDPRGEETLIHEAAIRLDEIEKGIIVESEKIADDYAAMKIGRKNAIKALEEIVSMIEGSFLCSKEPMARIERLKKKGRV